MTKTLLLTISSFALLALPLPLVAASAQDDIAQVLERLKQHYYDRIKEFEKENLELKTVVFLGDSLTEGFDLGRYFPGKRVLNRGIVADHIGLGKRGVLKRLDCSIFDCNPSDVFLMIGANDIGDLAREGRPSLDEMDSGYRRILSSIRERAPEVRIHIQSLLPTRGRHAHLNPLILEFNKRLRAMAEEFGLDYIDLHPLMADESGQLREGWTRDGLHLLRPAYDAWAAVIKRTMGWD